jgi:sugar phosphate isomerase/epimerase
MPARNREATRAATRSHDEKVENPARASVPSGVEPRFFEASKKSIPSRLRRPGWRKIKAGKESRVQLYVVSIVAVIYVVLTVRSSKYDDFACSSTLSWAFFSRAFSKPAGASRGRDFGPVPEPMAGLRLWRFLKTGQTTPWGIGSIPTRLENEKIFRNASGTPRGKSPLRSRARGAIVYGAGWSGGRRERAMFTRIGFDHYTIDHRRLSPEATLAFAQSHRFDGVQFLDPSAIDAALDPARLAAFRARADDLGLYLEVGLPSPNPVRRSREAHCPVSPEEHARDLAGHVEAVAALGCRHARAYVGDRHDRFRTDVSWADQCAATVDVLGLLTPRLRALGVRVAIETHADLTVDELLAMLDRLDPEIAGVTLDTGNLVMRLDDPVRAVERLAPRVLSTHVKDAVLAFTPRGLCWQARPIGSGILPIPDLLAPLLHANPHLNLSIELHPRTYDLPIYDRGWLAFFPDLRPDSLAAVVRLAAQAERRFAEGSLARPEAIEAIPWSERDQDWLASSLGYLRAVVPTLSRI